MPMHFHDLSKNRKFSDKTYENILKYSQLWSKDNLEDLRRLQNPEETFLTMSCTLSLRTEVRRGFLCFLY